MSDFDTRQSLTADARQPALPHASGTSSRPWELEPEETAAETFSEFISGAGGGSVHGGIKDNQREMKHNMEKALEILQKTLQ